MPPRARSTPTFSNGKMDVWVESINIRKEISTGGRGGRGREK